MLCDISVLSVSVHGFLLLVLLIIRASGVINGISVLCDISVLSVSVHGFLLLVLIVIMSPLE